MPAKSRTSSERIDRPFDKAVLRRARAIADRYQIILQFEDGLYYGRGLELPTAMNHGRTPDECVKATRDILTTAVAYLIESGQTPPAPASENRRRSKQDHSCDGSRRADRS